MTTGYSKSEEIDPWVSKSEEKGHQKWAKGHQKCAKRNRKGAKGSQKWASGSEKSPNGSQKGTQSEPNLKATASAADPS